MDMVTNKEMEVTDILVRTVNNSATDNPVFVSLPSALGRAKFSGVGEVEMVYTTVWPADSADRG